MRNIITIVVLVLVGCQSNPKQIENVIETKYSNGRTKSLSKILGDTLINDTIYRLKETTKYDSTGKKYRVGKYIDNQAIGVHNFYKNGFLQVKRNYVSWTKDDLSRLEKIDSALVSFVTQSTTYLNEVVFLDQSGSVKLEKSTICHFKVLNEDVQVGDTLKTEVTINEPTLEIFRIDLFLDVPNDTSLVRIITIDQKNFAYSQVIHPTESDRSKIYGLGILVGAQVEHLPNDTLIVYRPIKIDKTIEMKTRHNNSEHEEPL